MQVIHCRKCRRPLAALAEGVVLERALRLACPCGAAMAWYPAKPCANTPVAKPAAPESTEAQNRY